MSDQTWSEFAGPIVVSRNRRDRMVHPEEGPVNDVRAMTPTAETACLDQRGLMPAQVERLVALKRRLTRAEIDELTDEECRLRFARWLVDHGRLSEWPCCARAAVKAGREDAAQASRGAREPARRAPRWSWRAAWPPLRSQLQP